MSPSFCISLRKKHGPVPQPQELKQDLQDERVLQAMQTLGFQGFQGFRCERRVSQMPPVLCPLPPALAHWHSLKVFF